MCLGFAPVWRWHLFIAVYIARPWIVQWIAAHSHNDVSQDDNPIQRKIEPIGELNELIQIRSGRDMLAQHWVMANNIEALACLLWPRMFKYLGRQERSIGAVVRRDISFRE